MGDLFVKMEAEIEVAFLNQSVLGIADNFQK